MSEELIKKIITYNYNEFGNEFGDTIVDLKNEIERLNNIIQALKQTKLYCVDYETQEDIGKGNKIYIPFNLDSFIKGIGGD